MTNEKIGFNSVLLLQFYTSLDLGLSLFYLPPKNAELCVRKNRIMQDSAEYIL